VKQFLLHLAGQPFILATGAAAFVHSTWALATLFGGSEPTISTFAEGARWLGWMLPAAAISFALDVGQIYTASEIRAGQRTRTKYLTFATFAVFTYYLQWLHLVAHMPVIALSAGISEGAAGFATTVRDAALWVVPALLPLSTLLYTFSDRTPAPSEPERSLSVVQAQADGGFRVSCPDCGWTAEKETQESAQNALNGHRRIHPALVGAGPNGHTR
jgi:hypothetical protein